MEMERLGLTQSIEMRVRIVEEILGERVEQLQ